MISNARYLLPAIIFLRSFLISQTPALKEAGDLEEKGKFKEATALLRTSLRDSSSRSSDDERKTLAFELDRLGRIRMDYSLTKEQLFGQLQKSIKDLSREEFDTWIRDVRFDCRTIDDTLRFVGVSRSNLFWRYPELNERRTHPSQDSTFERAVQMAVRTISDASLSTNTPLVLPKRFKTRMTVTVEPDVTSPGDTIRAWLPIPHAFPHQRDFTLTASSSPVQYLTDEHSPIRSAYLEQAAGKDQATIFWIEYSYSAYGVRFHLNPLDVQLYDPNDTVVVHFTKEAPHIVFTDSIRRLSSAIGGADANPLVKAKRFYDWISEHIRYSYAREYSTLRNISDYCLTKRYGDCGQEALLFMTLCRYNAIPARWQSGWFTIPGGKTIHDWTEIYIKPYGWIPVDPYMGIFAMQYFTGATPEQRREVRDFYFGGLDQYRMAANSDHCQTLSPPKRTFRSDNVDFQRGELEYGNSNIYFNHYSYDLEVEELPLAR